MVGPALAPQARHSHAAVARARQGPATVRRAGLVRRTLWRWSIVLYGIGSGLVLGTLGDYRAHLGWRMLAVLGVVMVGAWLSDQWQNPPA